MLGQFKDIWDDLSQYHVLLLILLNRLFFSITLIYFIPGVLMRSNIYYWGK